MWSGTSASAALVSGEAAVLLSRSDLKNLKAKDVVRRISERVDHVQGKYDLGKGRINVREALRK